MRLDETLGATLRMLRSRGFTALPSRGLARRFEGMLGCHRGPVRIELVISDWDFVKYPAIRVLDAPSELPTLAPHLDAGRELCYFASGAAILDRYDPEHAIAQCLDQATAELNRLMAGAGYREGEFQTEFGANWSVGQLPPPFPILLGIISRDHDQAGVFSMGPGDERYVMVTSHGDEADGLCRVRGWPTPTTIASTCWIIRSHQRPSLPQGALPCTIGEMFTWIKEWDRAAYSSIQRILTHKQYLAFDEVTFLLQTGAGWFGFEFTMDRLKRLGCQRRPTTMRQSLHGRGGNRPVVRLSVHEVGPDFVHSRNLSHSSLKDLRITLIGCGAIGGYLAQSLVKLGAGSGDGQLTLIDSEILQAENLGRHLLGFESLFVPKARALQQNLTRQFPSSNVLAVERPAQFGSDLKGDLIIDATGEEAFSEALNHWRLQQPAALRAPVLHVWILGTGEGTQALWVDTAKFACYRCLRRNDAARTPRFDLPPPPADIRGLGCRAFTPYAVSAPLAAASLGIDAIISWLHGDPSPRFRTRAKEGTRIRNIKSQNLAPLLGCPACSPRH